MINCEGFTAAQKNMMLLSQQTLEGLRITSIYDLFTFTIYKYDFFRFYTYVILLVASFTEMTPLLLGLPGVICFFSEKLCQDPIESFFGKQRARGGRSDNPTVKQFCENTASLRVQGSAALEPVRGNCGKRKHDSLSSVDIATPLPKRKRYSNIIQCIIHLYSLSVHCSC